MISREQITSFTGHLVVLLVLMFIVLDIAEGRRFAGAWEREQRFAEQQRAIYDFAMDPANGLKPRVTRRECTYRTEGK